VNISLDLLIEQFDNNNDLIDLHCVINLYKD